MGYWIGNTPIGKGFKYLTVETGSEIWEVLQRAGWDEDNDLPNIDWQRDEAVIVATNICYKSALLTFHSLVRKDDHTILY